jgi:hypothetical protein
VAHLAAGAEVSFDCSLPLQRWRRGWLGLLSDPCSCCARGFQSRSVRNLAAKPFGKSAFIVGVDLRIVAATRHRDVSQATIDELLSRLLGVHMDEHAIRSLSLTAVTRQRVAIIEMRILTNVECDGATGVETDSEIATLVDLLDLVSTNWCSGRV